MAEESRTSCRCLKAFYWVKHACCSCSDLRKPWYWWYINWVKENVIDKGFIPVGLCFFRLPAYILKRMCRGQTWWRRFKNGRRIWGQIKRTPSSSRYIWCRRLRSSWNFSIHQTTNGRISIQSRNKWILYLLYAMRGCMSVKAISESNPKEIDSSICLRCGSCLRICPTQAKYFTEEPFKVLQEKLSPLCGVRKENWYTIA